MPRYFNTTGSCRPEKHYMLPPEERIPDVQGFVDRGLYFVVHAPRQSGKTTCFRTLADSLTEVAELYGQHTADTGQVFTPEALTLAWELTRGQPWLVNALARQAVEKVAPDPATSVTPGVIEAAKEILHPAPRYAPRLADRSPA